MKTSTKGTALITGASAGIGATYADRLARRGYDLILVARNRGRLDTLATRLASETGRYARTVIADLNNRVDLARVENLLQTDDGISLLVNNAGTAAPNELLDSDVDRLEEMIDLNATVPMRLSYAVVPVFLMRGGGTIVNIASALGIAPELYNGVYGGTKAFLLAFSRSLHKEFAARNIRVQAVLPGATATGLWTTAGTPVEQLPREIVMTVDDMVDAALVGLDQGELVTIPSLPDVGDWEAYEAARRRLIPNLSRNLPADRYRPCAVDGTGGR